jgi:hypothetical protein
MDFDNEPENIDEYFSEEEEEYNESDTDTEEKKVDPIKIGGASSDEEIDGEGVDEDDNDVEEDDLIENESEIDEENEPTNEKEPKPKNCNGLNTGDYGYSNYDSYNQDEYIYIYFVRHGHGFHNQAFENKTYDNNDITLQDPLLTPKGEKQCEILKNKISNVKFNYFYSSPLRRTITYL